MDWKVWKPKYDEIVKRLKLNEESDRKSAKIISEILPEIDQTELKKKIDGRECIVFGAGPSLEKDLDLLEKNGWLKKTLVTADGATSAVMNYRTPDVIVTDLDGIVEDQLEAWEDGAWMVVHAHGDNIPEVKKIVPKLKERVIGSIQVNQPAEITNFGGFTDGDRAAFLSHHFGASTIYLAGMNLGTDIGRWTGKTDITQKIEKLSICKELLSWLSEEFGANIINITTSGTDIPNVPWKEIK